MSDHGPLPDYYLHIKNEDHEKYLSGRMDFEKMVNEYDKRRRYLLRSFNELSIDCYNAQGAFYLFPSIKKFNMTSREFCLKLLNEYNVLVVPGTAFGNNGEGFIRISYATSLEKLEIFINALKEMVVKYYYEKK